MTRRVLIIEGRFYEDIAEALAKGAGAVLDAAGVDHERMGVPGVFEVPAAIGFAMRAAEDGNTAHTYDGFIALGAVIRGETDHYDHICREASRALMDLALRRGAALGFGILTCETYDQAWTRADVDGKNKGAAAADACLAMMELKKTFAPVSR